MKLLTKDLARKLPGLYSTEKVPLMDKVVVCKFFCPWNQWTWYIIEGSQEGDDWIFFAFVIGFESEFGNVALSELEGVKMFGLGIERDYNWKPTRILEVPEITRHL